MLVVADRPGGNSFSRKASKYQAFAYILFIAITVLFYLTAAVTSDPARPAIIAVFTLSFFGTILTTFICSLIDPTDPLIEQYYDSLDGPQQSSSLGHTGNMYCEVCRSVVGQGSKHCCACSRCVKGFDHHCKWINNCIGESNYRWFVAMCVSTLCCLSAFVAEAFILIWEQGVWLGAKVVVWCVGLAAGVLALLLLNLLVFHLYLNCKGLTTYEFILSRSREEAEVAPKQPLQRGDETKHSLQY